MKNSSPIKLHILSDLHLSRGGLTLPDTDADVVILAGDICRPKEAVQWAQGIAKPVIYIAGNHEFYGNSIRSTINDLRQRCAGTHIHFLNETQLALQGVRFLGVTLWTDFLLYGGAEIRDKAIAEALRFSRDFIRIQSDETPGQPFTPEQSEILFSMHRRWLEQKLSEPFEGPTVVITHHAPSPQSIHSRFAGSTANPSFVSNLEHLMGAERVALWIHGHTHDSFDYAVNGTRVVCNPRGYMKDGVNENPLFNPGLVVNVG